MRLHRPKSGPERVLDMLGVSKNRHRKAIYILARTNPHLETLEAQQTAYQQTLAKILSRLWLTVTLHPPQKLLFRLTSAIKLLTQLVKRKLRMGGIP